MKASRLREAALCIGALSFLILVSIGWLTTTNLSRAIVLSTRVASILVVAMSLGVLVSLNGIAYRQVATGAAYIALVLWGLFLSVANGAFAIGSHGVVTNAIVTLVGVTLLQFANDRNGSSVIAKYYLTYVVLGLLVTIAIGGLVLGFPPRFEFEYATNLLGTEEVYSQGMSKFFGLGAIAAILVAGQSRSPSAQLQLTTIAAVFLLLSLLGGARGDSILAALVTLGYFAVRFPVRLVVAIPILLGAAYVLVEDWSWIERLVVYQRLKVLGEGDLGLRDVLFGQAISLLAQEPRCLAIGCGIGFFQSYHGYDFELFPHNFVLESLITFGAPTTLLASLCVVAGFRLYCRRYGVDLFVLFFLYHALIGLKSSTLFGGWIVATFSLYLASLYFGVLFSRRRYGEQNIEKEWIPTRRVA